METSDAHGNLFYSKGDRFHSSFEAEDALKLMKKRQGVDVGHRLGHWRILRTSQPSSWHLW